MNYLIAGLAKTGTTILFTSVRDSLPGRKECFFEPGTEEDFERIFARGSRGLTVTKALLTKALTQDHIVGGFQRVMFIVRDPRDQLISELLYRFADFKERRDRTGYERARALLRAKIDDPATVSTIRLFDEISALAGRPGTENLANKYRRVVEFLQRYQPHAVRYEEFVQGRVEELSRYLGVPVSIAPAVDREYHRVERTRSSGEWRSWLTTEDLGFVNEALADSMKALDYPVVSSADQRAPIPVATTLEYITQFRP